MLRRFHPLCFALVALGLIGAFITLAARYRVEARNRRVALVLDDAQVRALAASTGVPAADAFRQLKEAGATGVAAARSARPIPAAPSRKPGSGDQTLSPPVPGTDAENPPGPRPGCR